MTMIGAIALLLFCQLAGEILHRLTGLPLPGSVIGMVLFTGPIFAGASALAATEGLRAWYWRTYTVFVAGA